MLSSITHSHDLSCFRPSLVLTPSLSLSLLCPDLFSGKCPLAPAKWYTHSTVHPKWYTASHRSMLHALYSARALDMPHSICPTLYAPLYMPHSIHAHATHPSRSSTRGGGEDGSYESCSISITCKRPDCSQPGRWGQRCRCRPARTHTPAIWKPPTCHDTTLARRQASLPYPTSGNGAI